MGDAERVIVRCSGRYDGFGIANLRVKEGDVVTLISGVSMPMILRPRGEHFEVVGPALLGGLMNGQLWTSEIQESLEDMVLI